MRVGPLDETEPVARTPDAPVTPAVLRWAREDADLTTADVARFAGVKPAVADAWEAGAAKPTLSQLRHLADAMRRPVAFFLTPAPPKEHAKLPPDFRSHEGAPSPGLRREVRSAQERRDAYLGFVGPVRDPWLAVVPTDSSSIREWLGVSTEEIRQTLDPGAALKVWIRALEQRGVLVFQMSRVDPAECRGFALAHWVCPVIVLNGADAPQARSFTLLQELAHLLDREGGLCLLQDDVDIERRCNRTAAAVLLPEEFVSTEARSAGGLDLVDSVVRGFRVSPQVAAFRLRDLGLIDEEIVVQVLARVAAAARRAAERKDSRGPAHHVLLRRNLGDRYVAAVVEAMHADSISVTDAAYLLDARVRTVQRLEQAMAGSGR